VSFLRVVRAIHCLAWFSDHIHSLMTIKKTGVLLAYVDIHTCFLVVFPECTHALPVRNSFGDELYIHRSLHNYDKVMKKFARDKPVSLICTVLPLLQ